MIIKSFFRNKTVKIYMIILTIAISVLFILSSFISYYQNMQDELFLNRNILIVTSKNNIYDDLKKIKLINNIENKVVLLPDKTYNTIVDSQYTLTDSEGNIVDSFTSNEDGYEFKITWERLFISNFDYILVTSDKNTKNKLSKNDVSIGLPESWVKYYSDHQDLYLNKNVGFKTNEQNKLELKIVNLYNSNFPQLMVSEELYNDLIKEQKFNVYTMNILSYSESNRVIKEVNTLNDKSDYFSTAFDCSYKDFESNTINNIDNLIGILKLSSYVILFVFVILIIIIIKNLLYDLNKSTTLESKIGFSKKQIKLNVVYRLLLLLLFSTLFSVMLSLIIILIINYTFKLNIILFNGIFFLKILALVFLIALCMILLKKYWNLSKYSV